MARLQKLSVYNVLYCLVKEELVSESIHENESFVDVTFRLILVSESIASVVDLMVSLF